MALHLHKYKILHMKDSMNSGPTPIAGHHILLQFQPYVLVLATELDKPLFDKYGEGYVFVKPAYLPTVVNQNIVVDTHKREQIYRQLVVCVCKLVEQPIQITQSNIFDSRGN